MFPTDRIASKTITQISQMRYSLGNVLNDLLGETNICNIHAYFVIHVYHTNFEKSLLRIKNSLIFPKVGEV
jgi:DNA-directed RNA polymerase subunit L